MSKILYSEPDSLSQHTAVYLLQPQAVPHYHTSLHQALPVREAGLPLQTLIPDLLALKVGGGESPFPLSM